MSTKVLLDTDIDILGDIDDVMCLAYLLARPDCELVGITTGTYATEQRAMVASAMCKAAGKHVPILPGAELPLLAPLPQVSGLDTGQDEQQALQRWPRETTFPVGQAVEFMRRAIRDHPGEIVLLAVGPLTNIALLFAVDPEIPTLLKSLVLMCGAFSEDRTEWNARFDPHATAMVYRAPVTIHRSIGLDVTEQIRLDAIGFRAHFHSTGSPLLWDWAEVWFRHRREIVFHDPLAAATIFDDTICRFDRGTVEVELHGEQQGLTRWQPGGANAPHEVSLSVDRERFLEHYFDVFR